MRSKLSFLFSLFLCSCENVQYFNMYPSQRSAKIVWKQGPSLMKENSFIISFWDEMELSNEENPHLSSQYQLSVNLWMRNCGTAMGHASSPVKINKLSAGVYEVSKAYFVMKGAWEITILLKNKDHSEAAILYLDIEK